MYKWAKMAVLKPQSEHSYAVAICQSTLEKEMHSARIKQRLRSRTHFPGRKAFYLEDSNRLHIKAESLHSSLINHMLCMGHTHHLVSPSRVAQWLGIRSTLRRQCEKWTGQNSYGAYTQYALECYFHPKLYNLVFFIFSDFFFYVYGYLACIPHLPARRVSMPMELKL